MIHCLTEGVWVRNGFGVLAGSAAGTLLGFVASYTCGDRRWEACLWVGEVKHSKLIGYFRYLKDAKYAVEEALVAADKAKEAGEIPM